MSRMVRTVKGAYGKRIPSLPAVAMQASLILARLNRPVHYRKLAEMVWNEMGISSDSKEEERQSAEHLREYASWKRYGLRYVGESVVGIGHPDVGLVFDADWVDGEDEEYVDKKTAHRRSLVKEASLSGDFSYESLRMAK